MKLKKLFARYMRVKDPDKAHAVLSASGATRWLNCPGSIRLGEGIQSEDNEHSIAGTNTHTLLQFILENAEYETLLKTKEAKAFKEFIDFSKEKLASALFAADYVWSEMRLMKEKTGYAPKLFTEQKLELSGVGFGTSDIVLYEPFGLIHVMDYKNGQKAVEVKGNWQGLYYAHAAADFFGWDFSRLAITIIQPNASHKEGPIRTWKPSLKRLERAGETFRRGAKLTQKSDARLIMGSWCWFCPARSICPKQMKDKERKIMSRFDNNPGL